MFSQVLCGSFRRKNYCTQCCYCQVKASWKCYSKPHKYLDAVRCSIKPTELINTHAKAVTTNSGLQTSLIAASAGFPLSFL